MFISRRVLARTSIGIVIFLLGSIARSAPIAKNIDIRGLQIGSSNTITIEGDRLSPNPRIHSPLRIKHQKANVWSAEKVSFEIELDDKIEPDIYPFRIVTNDGISNAFLMGVDTLPQTAITNSVEKFPVALHGNLAGSTIHKIAIKSTQGEKLVVDIEGNRIGSNIRPVLRLYDDRGRQVAWAKPSRFIAGDARLQTTIEQDGIYSLEIQDKVFKGPSPSFFRLKIGQLNFADLAMPMSISATEPTAVQFASSNLDKSVWISNRSEGADFIKVNVPETVETFTGARPVVGLNRIHDELVEDDSRKKEAIAAPVAISGCIDQKGETDRFKFVVRPETKYRCEVFSHQLGTSLDSVLTVLDASGVQIGRNDDHAKSLDPGLEFTSPKDGNEIIVELSSLAGNFGPDCVYRLHVSESDLNAFDITAAVDSVSTESGNRVVIPLEINRSGYGGKIEVSLDRSSSDVFSSLSVVLEASDEIGLFAFSVPEFTQAVVPVRVRATAIDHSVSPSQLVRIRTIGGLQSNAPWNQEIVTAVRLGSSPTVNWKNAIPSRLVQGTHEWVGIDFGESTKSPVRFSLVTSQPMQKKKEGDKEVDDVERALRIEEQTVEAGAVDAALKVIVPQDLQERNWLVSVKAEYLSDDKTHVVSTDYTEPVRLASVIALSANLESESEAKPKIKIGEGAFVEFKGSVNRLDGFDYPVRILLTGLPKEYGTPSVSLPKDQSAFSLALSLRRENDAKMLKDIQLIALFDMPVDEKYTGIRSKTIPIEIELIK